MLTCFNLLRSIALAQPDWSVNPSEFEHSMSIVGTAWLGGQEISSDEAKVGAFIGEKCVGVASPMLNEATGRYLFFMVVFGNSGDIQSQVRFEVYADGGVVEVPTADLQFEVDAIIGDVELPMVVAEPMLKEGNEILSFDLGPNTLDVKIGSDEISAIIDASSPLTDLPVSFVLSEGAVLAVEGQQWASGEASMSYAEPVELHVFSEGLFNERIYTLKIAGEQDVIVANNIISPNGDGINDTWEIAEPERYTDYRFEIRSQGGELIFNQTGYSSPWDGTYKGNRLPLGTYWYNIKNLSTKKVLRGYITLIY